MSLSLDSIHQRMDRALCRVGTAELRMEISLILRHFRQGIINLVIQTHLFRIINILQRYACFLTERHLPVAIERAPGIYTDRQRGKLGILIKSTGEEIPDRTFNRRLFLVVPIHTEYRESPVASGSHPYLLDSPRAINLRDSNCLPRFHDNKRIYFPAFPQIFRWASCIRLIPDILISHGISHRSFPFLPRKILRTDRTTLRIRQTRKVSHIHIQPVKRILLGIRPKT